MKKINFSFRNIFFLYSKLFFYICKHNLYRTVYKYDKLLAKNIMKVTEIMAQATKVQRVNIVNNITIEGRASVQTVYSWLRGERTPMYLYQKLIASAVNKYMGTSFAPEDLFDPMSTSEPSKQQMS